MAEQNVERRLMAADEEEALVGAGPLPEVSNGARSDRTICYVRDRSPRCGALGKSADIVRSTHARVETRRVRRVLEQRSRTAIRVNLKWFETDGRLNLRWSETGGPTIERPTRKGLGGKIIERMIAQLRGKVSFDWRPEGLVCELSFHVV
jgi:hypothetical protein